jgi:hypothetical protein
MLVTRHAFNEFCNLDYDKIIIEIVSFLPMTFNDDILFEMHLLSLSNLSLSQMQGMDKKYDGHAWSKVITTNIKNTLVSTSRRLTVWVTCIMSRSTTIVSFILRLAMRLFG